MYTVYTYKLNYYYLYIITYTVYALSNNLKFYFLIFYSYGFIHRKNRNRLTCDRAGKLTYLCQNYKLLSESNAISKNIDYRRQHFEDEEDVEEEFVRDTENNVIDSVIDVDDHQLDYHHSSLSISESEDFFGFDGNDEG